MIYGAAPRRPKFTLLCISLYFALANGLVATTKSWWIKQKSDSTHLSARPWRYPGESSAGEEDDNHGASSEKERPTQTRTESPSPDLLPSKPKIVVLGATGKIGRLVIQQLLENTSLGGATVVAIVRDYDKACRVLYDDLLLVNSKTKPKLQIIQADLVPPEELPGFEYKEDEEEEEEWLARASSAAEFYGNSVSDYDNRNITSYWSANEALRDAIRDCTTIISCVGTVRPTNLWTDYLARPLWRILRQNVRDWCRDPRHPYYVNYASTLKALDYAEKEQARRQAALEPLQSEDNDEEAPKIPRIRFVRISDLCVAQQPWHFVPLLTNIIHSMVFRYQEMTEQLLGSSSLIDTIVLRPGDLCDEERNATTTALQVSHTGSVPLPSRVGRDDVASLACAAALWQSPDDSDTTTATDQQKQEPFHFTFGVRWVGDGLDPYPSQGRKSDGLPDAHQCLQSATKLLQKEQKRERRRQMRRKAKGGILAQFQVQKWKMRLKPHGICAAIPVYLVLFLCFRSSYQALLFRGPACLRPFFARIRELLAMAVASIAGPLGLVLRNSLKTLTGRATRQYISF